MTAEQVIQLADFNARELGLKWFITKSRDIRLKHEATEYCPLEVAAGFVHYREAARDLQLTEAAKVMCGADDVYLTINPESMPRAKVLRQLMLETFEFEVSRAEHTR